MKCPSCQSTINLKKSKFEKLDFFRHEFECQSCNLTLINNVNGELVRALGFIIMIFGILTFGGSWPIPLLKPIESGIISITGVALLLVGQKMASVAVKCVRS